MKNNSYADEIADVVKRYLEKDLVKYYYEEDTHFFYFSTILSGRLNYAQYWISILGNSYTVSAELPMGIDEEDKTVIDTLEKFVYLANYKMYCEKDPEGCELVLQPDAGRIISQCVVDCSLDYPSEGTILTSVWHTAKVFEMFDSGILGIIFGNMTAEEALALCEKKITIRRKMEADRRKRFACQE